MNRRNLLIGACAITAVVAYTFLRSGPAEETAQSASVDGEAIVAIQMPSVDGVAAIGQSIFENACASCHGTNAVGNEGAGPPLIHVIYEPGHHGDESFQRAVAVGVKSHHWRFGDMPPVEGLTRGDVTMIVSFIRALQRANGIN